jgi:hypothetical protein
MMAPMIFHKPGLRLGILVFERLPIYEQRMGRVARMYDLDGEMRVVVKFEDGSEFVFFDFELIVAEAQAAC